MRAPRPGQPVNPMASVGHHLGTWNCFATFPEEVPELLAGLGHLWWCWCPQFKPPTS